MTPPRQPLPLDTPPSAPPTPGLRARWLKRLGVAGFVFFLVKGLLWLIVPAVGAVFYARGCAS